MFAIQIISMTNAYRKKKINQGASFVPNSEGKPEVQLKNKNDTQRAFYNDVITSTDMHILTQGNRLAGSTRDNELKDLEEKEKEKVEDDQQLL